MNASASNTINTSKPRKFTPSEFDKLYNVHYGANSIECKLCGAVFNVHAPDVEIVDHRCKVENIK